MQNEERHKVHTQFERPPDSGIRNRRNMSCHKQFPKRTDLETSDCLKDDCLKVHCRLFETGKGTDVNFKFDGETSAAHSEGHSSDYEGSSPERTASQPSSHVEDPSGSFLEGYHQFPLLSCEVKNQDGSIRCMQHERPKKAPNVPRTGPIGADLFDECMLMIEYLKQAVYTQLDQKVSSRAQLAESLIQTLVEGLRVGVGPSQQDNERGSGSSGTRSSRRDNGGGSGSRGLTPSNEDENNKLGQFLAKQGQFLAKQRQFLEEQSQLFEKQSQLFEKQIKLFFPVFLFFLALFLFFCLFVFLYFGE